MRLLGGPQLGADRLTETLPDPGIGKVTGMAIDPTPGVERENEQIAERRQPIES
jgi:hypothetical protein